MNERATTSFNKLPKLQRSDVVEDLKNGFTTVFGVQYQGKLRSDCCVITVGL